MHKHPRIPSRDRDLCGRWRPLRLSPILSALLSLLGIIKENGCFPEPGPGPSALPALPKSPCNKFIGITLPSPNPGPSPRTGDLKGLEPGR